MNDLDNSITFDSYRRLNNGKQVVSDLLDKIIPTLNRKKAWSDKAYTRARKTLNVILANLLPQCFPLNSKYLAIGLNSNLYRPNIYKPYFITHKILRALIAGLVKLDFISMYIGFYDRAQNIGRNTRLCITDEFKQFLFNYNFGIESIQSDYRTRPLVVLKDTKRKMINYPSDERTESMKGNLLLFNQLIECSDIKLNLNEEQTLALMERMSNRDEPRCLDLSRHVLYRVFNNNSFHQGGRSYGGFWQQIPGEFRKYITINGRQTIEHDYAECHPRLLYHIHGHVAPVGDCYNIEGYGEEYRDSVKVYFNIMLNATDRTKTLKANRNRIRLPVGQSLEELELAINRKHYLVADYFYTGIGLELMNYDSIIADSVMLELANEDITCLPIHDSFIVQSSYSNELIVAMRKAYHVHIGFRAKLKSELTNNATNMIMRLRELSLSNNDLNSELTE